MDTKLKQMNNIVSNTPAFSLKTFFGKIKVLERLEGKFVVLKSRRDDKESFQSANAIIALQTKEILVYASKHDVSSEHEQEKVKKFNSRDKLLWGFVAIAIAQSVLLGLNFAGMHGAVAESVKNALLIGESIFILLASYGIFGILKEFKNDHRLVRFKNLQNGI